jgi:hypothetical protein
MNCPKCHATLMRRNSAGDAIIRNRGILLKASGPALVCPRCRADVPFQADLLVKALPVLLLHRPGRR